MTDLKITLTVHVADDDTVTVDEPVVEAGPSNPPVDPPTDPPVEPPVVDDEYRVGFNLSSIQYWAAQWLTANKIKSAELDPGQPPKLVIPTHEGGRLVLRYQSPYGGQETQHRLPDRDHDETAYDGMVFRVRAPISAEKQPGRLVFDTQKDARFEIIFVRGAISEYGEMDLREENMSQEAVFHPELISVLRDRSSVIRTMDLTRTNRGLFQPPSRNPPFDSIDKFPTGEEVTWNNQFGVSVKTLCDLAKESGNDLWYAVPDQIPPEEFTALARRFKEHLDPETRLIVSFSNEVWNGNFGQFRRLADLSVAMGLTESTTSPSEAYCLRLCQVAEAFRAEVPGVVICFDTRNGLNSHLPAPEPGKYDRRQNATLRFQARYTPPGYDRPTIAHADWVAIAPYFGNGLPLLNRTTEEVLADLEVEAQKRIDGFAYQMEELQMLADEAGVPRPELVVYEGNGHLNPTRPTQNEGESAEDFNDRRKAELEQQVQRMSEVYRTPEFKDQYARVIASYKASGGKFWCAYNLTGRPHSSGDWGHMVDMRDPDSPRMLAINESRSEP
jgi:hypothetical protein